MPCLLEEFCNFAPKLTNIESESTIYIINVDLNFNLNLNLDLDFGDLT